MASLPELYSCMPVCNKFAAFDFGAINDDGRVVRQDNNSAQES